jgi:hypothetical protein
VYGDALFVIDPQGARERVQACDEWATHVRAAADGAPGTRADWPGLLRFFAQQRRSESEQVGASQASLRDTVRSLSRDLQHCLLSTRRHDAEVALAAVRVNAALDAHDEPRLLEDSQALIAKVLEAASARHAAHELQRHELCALIAEVEAARHAPGRTDPATRLPGPDALRDHLEFVAVVGRLMQSPPLLLLVSVDATALDLPGDSVARLLADETLRRFFAREHFVARAGETLVAAVLPASDSGAAVASAEATLAALGRSGVALQAQAAALATLVPGESAQVWWQRCHDQLVLRPWDGRCRVAAVPAVFD